MALTFQGISKSDIESGIIASIAVAPSTASTTWTDVGDFTHPIISVRGMTLPSDPSGSMMTYALKFEFSFSIVQSKKTAELAAMTGTAGTGLYETDILIRFTYMSGRVLTLGAVTTAPLRPTLDYLNGGEEEAQRIEITGVTIEPITSFAAKVA